MIFRQLWAIVIDTVREASARKIFLGMTLSATLCAALMVWYMQTLTSREPHSVLLALEQSDPRFLDPAFLARNVLGTLATPSIWAQVGCAIALLTGLMAPMLSAERNALVVVAPVPRPLLLFGRYLGLLSISLWSTIVMFMEIWAVSVWKFDVWHWPFLAGIGVTAVVVAGTLALLILVQSAVNSASVAIVLLTAANMLALGARYPERVRDMTGSAMLAEAGRVLGNVMPRGSEAAEWAAIYINSGVLGDTSPFWSTAAASVVFLIGAAAFFQRKEF